MRPALRVDRGVQILTRRSAEVQCRNCDTFIEDFQLGGTLQRS